MYVCEILSNSQIMSYFTTEITQTSIKIKRKLHFFKSGREKLLETLDTFSNVKMNMSHFAYACKMWYPLNLVLESWQYLWFY